MDIYIIVMQGSPKPSRCSTPPLLVKDCALFPAAHIYVFIVLLALLFPLSSMSKSSARCAISNITQVQLKELETMSLALRGHNGIKSVEDKGDSVWKHWPLDSAGNPNCCHSCCFPSFRSNNQPSVVLRRLWISALPARKPVITCGPRSGSPEHVPYTFIRLNVV